MAATDILGRRPQTVSKAYSADAFQMSLGGIDARSSGKGSFLLLQNMTMQYAQSVTRLFDLENSTFQAYVASRPQGQLGLQNVVTDIQGMTTFTQKYGDPCSADQSKNFTISISRNGTSGGTSSNGGMCSLESGSLTFTQPVLISVSMSVSVADYMIGNSMGFLFASVQGGKA